MAQNEHPVLVDKQVSLQLVCFPVDAMIKGTDGSGGTKFTTRATGDDATTLII